MRHLRVKDKEIMVAQSFYFPFPFLVLVTAVNSMKLRPGLRNKGKGGTYVWSVQNVIQRPSTQQFLSFFFLSLSGPTFCEWACNAWPWTRKKKKIKEIVTRPSFSFLSLKWTQSFPLFLYIWVHIVKEKEKE